MDKQTLKDGLNRLSRKELIDIILQQAEAIERLQKENEQLRKRIEELERASNRQAAPFRVKEHKKKRQPKPPGRKPGHKGHYRTIGKEEIQQTIEVPLLECPHCHGEVEPTGDTEQIIEEIPVIKKQVYRVLTQSGRCSKCGVVSSTHPLQTSTASGAAKVQLGPNAKALGVSLQHEYGLSKRKTCEVFQNIFDINITPGGLVHATHRAAQCTAPQYAQILGRLRKSPVLHSDETSWYVGAPNYWLWVFANPEATLYQVSSSRGRKVITNAIGPQYSGTLVSDCLVIYDDVNPSQHKCYSHHLKAISLALEKAGPKQKSYLQKLQKMLKEAMALKEAKPEKPPDQYWAKCRKLELKADRLLGRPRKDKLEEKVANRLRKQRDHLFTFLYHDEVDATNNLAERQLRPAVISRKISCGNRTDRGARSWQILASLAATAAQNDQDFSQIIKQSISIHPTA